MTEILISLSYSTLLLSAGCLIAVVLLGATRCRSWWLRRFVWSVVLLLGIVPLCGLQWTVDVPVLEEQSRNLQIAEESHASRHASRERNAVERPDEPAVDPVTPAIAFVSGFHDTPPPIEIVKPPQRNLTIAALFVLWFFGIIIVLARTLFYSFRFHYLLREAEPAGDDWTNAWNAMQTALSVRRPIPMLTSDTHGPVLVRRWFDYVFVVPLEGWDNLSETQRKSVMRHELEHYRRGDVWTSAIARLITLIHWFNPLAYFSLFRFEDAAEWACDEAALGKRGESTKTFASALVSLNKSLNVSMPKVLCGHGIFSRDSSRRVARISSFESTLNKKESIMKKVFLFTIVVLLFAAVFVRVRLVAQQESNNASRERNAVERPDEPGVPAKNPAPLFNPKLTKITGMALLPDGSPAADMRLLVSGRMKTNPPTAGASNSFTQADGRFFINAFVPAESMLSIFDPKGKWAAPSQSLSLNDDDEYVEKIVFQLKEGICITGKVVDGTSGKPLPNIDISIAFYENETNDSNQTFFKIKTDEKGEYEFAALPTDDVYVSVGTIPIHRLIESVQRQEYRAKLLQKVSFDGQPVVKLNDFRLSDPFVGKVLRADGSPAANVCFQAHSNRPGYHTYDAANTDENGMFYLAERPQHVFCTIWLQSPTGFPGTYEAFMGWFDDDLPKTGEKVFQLHKACSIRGRLIDSATKKPLADQLVLLERSNVANPKQTDPMPLAAKTDGSGNYQVYIVAGVQYELFIVPGMENFYGSVPPDVPRVVLKSFVPEKPGEAVSLEDIEVDML